ncbi:putative surface-exposed protein [Yersinia nurmii]|uniref:Surface-exposed protein n=2 Tax=Yersinia nurmii TaxID=685706 RepID=A0ABM9S9C9_9GAMM|nr:putative surface-exposed protein [Yersinia nurmii]
MTGYSPMRENNRFIIHSIHYFLFYFVLLGLNQKSWANTPSVSGMVTGSAAILQDNEQLLSPEATRVQQKPVIDQREKSDSKSDTGQMLRVATLGVRSLPERYREQVNTLLVARQNQNMSVSQLQAIPLEIERIMRKGGDLLSFAYLPEQDITEGHVYIQVVQGRLEKVHLHNNQSGVRDSLINKFLQAGNKHPENIRQMESVLLRLGDQPGVGPLTSILSPGEQVGGSQLSVSVASEPAISGRLMMDNHGGRYSGRIRTLARMTINNPTGSADRLQGMVLYAPQFLQNKDSNDAKTILGNITYDLPLGYQGARGGISYSRVESQPGGRFTGFIDSNADVLSLYSSWPVIRTAGNNLSLGVQGDYKWMRDKILTFTSHREQDSISLSLNGDYRHRWFGQPNIVNYRGGLTRGTLRDAMQDNPNRGEFWKWEARGMGLQRLNDYFGASLRASGQFSHQNTDSVEKMALGGPLAVRAYDVNTISVDRGFSLSPALRLDLATLYPGISTHAFYDYAQGSLLANKRIGQSNHVLLQGYGAGLTYQHYRGNIDITHARRVGAVDNLLGATERSRWWLTGSINF